MSATTRFEARYSSQIVLEVSNPQNSGATTKDSTRISLADTDVTETFERYVGVAYDDDDTAHHGLIAEGMYWTLLSWTTQSDDQSTAGYNRWLEKLDRARMTIGGNKRIVPKSNSATTKTSENRGTSGVVRPAMDLPVFDDTRPNPPR